KYVASGGHVEGSFQVWDADTGEPLRTLVAEGGHPRFSPDGRWLATFQELSKRVRLWKTGSWEPGPNIGAVTPYGAFSPDGNLLAVGGEPGFVLLIRTETGEEVGRL